MTTPRSAHLLILVALVGCGDDATPPDAPSGEDAPAEDVRMSPDIPAADAPGDAASVDVPDDGGEDAGREAKEELLANVDAAGNVDTRPGVFAFPGATGHGKISTGGRGGPIYCVNTLEDVAEEGDGLISYREAISAVGDVTAGPRNITFCVSGIIDNSSTATIMRTGRITVACQSAPSPGVVIVGYRPQDIVGDVDDVVFRHCDIKIRSQLSNRDSTANAIYMTPTPAGGPDRLIFDHMSIMWSTDSSFGVRTGGAEADTPDDITLSHSIIGEGDTTCPRADNGCGDFTSTTGNPPRYVVGDSSHGPQLGDAQATRMDGFSMVANLVPNVDHRAPFVRGHVGVEIVNNLISNFHTSASLLGSYNDAYIEGNIYKDGPDTLRTRDRGIWIPNPTMGNYVIRNNVRIHFDGSVVENYVGDYTGPAIADIPGVAREYEGGVTELDLRCVGASRPLRDSADLRLVAEVNGTGNDPVSENAEIGIGPRIPPMVPPCLPGRPCFYEPPVMSQGQRDYSDYMESTTHGEDYDTDDDGIADAWERLVIESDPADDIETLADIDHTTDCDGDGYSDVEEWLNRLARCDL